LEYYQPGRIYSLLIYNFYFTLEPYPQNFYACTQNIFLFFKGDPMRILLICTALMVAGAMATDSERCGCNANKPKPNAKPQAVAVPAKPATKPAPQRPAPARPARAA